LQKGSQHGVVRVSLDGEELNRTPLVALEAVGEGNILQIAKDYILQMFN
jgi:D-alanyl-D-alanine carboxypeptidase (penicillin-binding protein 5/6)